jgi:hypothetical protein
MFPRTCVIIYHLYYALPHEELLLKYFDICTVHRVQFIIQTNKCTTYTIYIYTYIIYIYISSVLLHVSMHLHHIQAVLFLWNYICKTVQIVHTTTKLTTFMYCTYTFYRLCFIIHYNNHKNIYSTVFIDFVNLFL